MTKLLDLIEYRFIGALLPQCKKKQCKFRHKFSTIYDHQH